MRRGGPESYLGEYESTPEYLGPSVVSELNFYPVKSFAGTSLSMAEVGSRGFLHDREWMVVSPEGDFITQREIPEMALLKPVIGQDSLILTAPGAASAIEIPLGKSGDKVQVNVWRSKDVRAIDQGDQAAIWISRRLDRDCRLVRIAEDEIRQVDLAYALKGDQVGFADGFSFLLLSEASLIDLNHRLPEPLPMNRFRPNIVVNGVEPYVEDTWKRIRIGNIEFDVAKPCARCKITTTNQSNAEISKEPLKTLATYRRHDQLGIEGVTGVFFGQNLIHRGLGIIQLGDRVQVLEYK